VSTVPVYLDTLNDWDMGAPLVGFMIHVLFYHVVLTVTVSILFFTLCALSVDSCTPWLKHYEEGIYRRMNYPEVDCLLSTKGRKVSAQYRFEQRPTFVMLE
jgi:hypothetical protein